jgi:hypothetical protein
VPPPFSGGHPLQIGILVADHVDTEREPGYLLEAIELSTGF